MSFLDSAGFVPLNSKDKSFIPAPSPLSKSSVKKFVENVKFSSLFRSLLFAKINSVSV
jgi:hypothetical protein